MSWGLWLSGHRFGTSESRKEVLVKFVVTCHDMRTGWAQVEKI